MFSEISFCSPLFLPHPEKEDHKMFFKFRVGFHEKTPKNNKIKKKSLSNSGKLFGANNAQTRHVLYPSDQVSFSFFWTCSTTTQLSDILFFFCGQQQLEYRILQSHTTTTVFQKIIRRHKFSHQIFHAFCFVFSFLKKRDCWAWPLSITIVIQATVVGCLSEIITCFCNLMMAKAIPRTAPVTIVRILFFIVVDIKFCFFI